MALILLFFCFSLIHRIDVSLFLNYIISLYKSSTFYENEVIFIEFPQNLKTLRKQTGLTQAEFAKKAGLNYSNIRDYEQGVREPNFETLEKIKIALDCSYDDLLK